MFRGATARRSCSGPAPLRCSTATNRALSHDHGRTWDWDNRYILFRCPQGYKLFNPRTILLRDGRLMTAIYNYTSYTWSDLEREDSPDGWYDNLGLPYANYIGLGNVYVVLWELQD